MQNTKKSTFALLLIASILSFVGCNHGPDPGSAYLADAREAIAQARWNEAQAMAELAVEQQETDREALQTLAEIHRGQAQVALDADEPDIAFQHFQAAAEAEPSRVLRARDLLDAVHAGQLANRPATELAPIATLATRTDSSSTQAHILAARLWEDTPESQNAIDHYLWAWAAEPTQIQHGLRLGILYLTHQQFNDAAYVLGQVLDADPSNVQAAINRAEAFEQARDIHAARHTYQEIIAQFPDNAGILFRYAAFLERIGEHAAANTLRNQAQDTLPGIDRRELRKLK